MKIFTAAQLQEADAITINKQNISSTELMERAASLVFKEIHSRLQNADIEIKLFCGIGNNGGDGLVVARLLVEQGYRVKVYVVNYSDKRSQDFLINYDRFKNITKDWPVLIKRREEFPPVKKADFVIDAIFGIGLNRPLENWMAELVEYLNASGAFILAIDMPSGLFADKVFEKGTIVKANYTLSFQNPKLTFFLPQTMDFVGDFQILDIGLDRKFLAESKVKATLIGKREAKPLYRNRPKNSHKGNYGHTMVVGGSYGKIGSISLTAKAALKTGAGLCTIFSPSCGYNILQTAVPEAMVQTDENHDFLTEIKFDIDPDVICFGMGAGTDPDTAVAFKDLLGKTSRPLVIDADGLNLLAKNPEFLELLPEKSILTPHPKELERLIGKWNNDIEKLEKIQEFINRFNLVLVLKGAHTFCFSKDEIFINNSGNPGMATAGAGDVLSGVIAGLISQKYDSVVAAVFGVYLHGLAGDLATQKMSYEGLTAGEIINYLGSAFLELFREENGPEIKS